MPADGSMYKPIPQPGGSCGGGTGAAGRLGAVADEHQGRRRSHRARAVSARSRKAAVLLLQRRRRSRELDEPEPLQLMVVTRFARLQILVHRPW